MNATKPCRPTTLVVLLMAASISAQAQAQLAADAPRAFVGPPQAPAPAAARRPFASPALGEQALAARRGGDGALASAQLKGLVADNHASHVVTGSNAVADGSFTGSAGISTVIQNSGNNVLIQSSTIVNVRLQ